VAALLNEVVALAKREVEEMPGPPAGARYHFDREKAEGQARLRPVTKTVRRTVVSLRYSQFEALEVVRKGQEGSAVAACRSPELAAIVPPGQRYAYDLVAYVGIETFLGHRPLQEVDEELCKRCRGVGLPFSSLHEMQLKFLFYLGELHRQAAPRIEEHLRERGGVTWLVDGTLEPGTPVFFGVKEAGEGMMLYCRKLASENRPDITLCLSEAARIYGKPREVLHDLSELIAQACADALPEVPHRVCHYHLARDIGMDLYQEPHAALTAVVRSTKLHLRLKEQRRGQTEALRTNPAVSLALRALLNGEAVTIEDPQALGREVVLSLHHWVLDFASDGHRQGFPFDPYVLYFHRRVERAGKVLARVLSHEAVRAAAPRVLFSLARMLGEYLENPKVIAAVADYERAFLLFDRVRSALRLGAQGESPLRNAYVLDGEALWQAKQALAGLHQECRLGMEQASDAGEQKRCRIVCEHLGRYREVLFPTFERDAGQGPCPRTTNALESEWGRSKQRRRQIHGRKLLTRDFQTLPEEYMLVGNLENPEYVKLVLGDLDELPAKLAEVGKAAGPFSKWLEARHPLNVGRLPIRLLRREGLLGRVAETYEAACRALAA